jgi:hypothetical protein
MTRITWLRNFVCWRTILIHASKIAILKIQSWKFALKTPEVGTRYQMAAEEMVRESLLCYISNDHILSEEGYYFGALEN